MSHVVHTCAYMQAERSCTKIKKIRRSGERSESKAEVVVTKLPIHIQDRLYNSFVGTQESSVKHSKDSATGLCTRTGRVTWTQLHVLT